MIDDFHQIMRRLIGADGALALSQIDATALVHTSGDDEIAHLARANGSFLLTLCGDDEVAQAAKRTLDKDAARGNSIAAFLLRLRQWVLDEQRRLPERKRELAATREQAATWAKRSPASSWDTVAQKAIWGFLFPEGASCLEDPDATVSALRTRRTVTIERLNTQPIDDPITELLVTSNILLTLPADLSRIDELPLSQSQRDRVKVIADEEQQYWFDHPIPLDVDIESNEVVYGLRGLNEAVAFEKRNGRAAPDARMAIALAVSVTHTGLKTIARDYLQATLAAAPDMPHLDVYVFSEEATERLLDEVLAPAIASFREAHDFQALRHVFGVDGEYGRHYSFLKAIAAFWHVLIDPQVRATFKIDLDQVFPQEQLVAEGGGSAFEHFQSPLWGALGIDIDGNPVELGMLAGSLVNEKDIVHGLFTPDVPRPDHIPAGEAVAFFNRLPMALSTEAEMMTRYTSGGNGPDGKTTCLHRIHVTGGTNGILVDSLRRHRPFTPTFIGRAEDQAYLLSVLFNNSRPLRYVHSAGLIMRHDKEAFASMSIEAAKVGRFVGDMVRTLYFSHYVQALPWPDEQIKRTIDPFTGCFASYIPVTIVALRLTLRVGELLMNNSAESRVEAIELMTLAVNRLEPLIEQLTESPQVLTAEITRQRTGWGLYYDALDALENALARRDPVAQQLCQTARDIIRDCQVLPK